MSSLTKISYIKGGFMSFTILQIMKEIKNWKFEKICKPETKDYVIALQ